MNRELKFICEDENQPLKRWIRQTEAGTIFAARAIEGDRNGVAIAHNQKASSER